MAEQEVSPSPGGEQGYNPRPSSVAPTADEGAGASSLSSVCTLCNSAVGAGVLSLPFAFQSAGLVGCLLLCLAVVALEAFTMYILAKFAERYDAPSYGSLIRRALGRKTAAGLSAVVVVYLWGSCVAYLVIIGDTFTSLSSQHFGADAWCSQRTPVLLAVGLLVLLPCFARDLKALERISLLAVAGFIFTAGAVLVRGLQTAAARPPDERWADVAWFKFDVRALYAISIVVFGFNCHANVVGVFWELEHRPHRLIPALPAQPAEYQSLGSLAPKPYTFKLIGMLGAIIAAMSIILTGYSCVGIAGYVAYPRTVSSNVLNSFPAADMTIQAARAVIALVVIAHFPLNHHPARAAWEDLLDAVAGVKEIHPWASAVLTVLFVGSSVATSLLVSDLGEVLHLLGGSVAAFIIFTLPGLLCMNAAIIKHTVSFGNLSQLVEEPEDSEAGWPAPSSTNEPLLIDKRAGIRDAGLVFAPGKSWSVGLMLVVISGLVLGVTVFTAID